MGRFRGGYRRQNNYPSYQQQQPDMRAENMKNLDGWQKHYESKLEEVASKAKLSKEVKDSARLKVMGRMNAVRDMVHGSQQNFLKAHEVMRADIDAYLLQLEQGAKGVQESDKNQDEWCDQTGVLDFKLSKKEPIYIRYDREYRSGSLQGWIRVNTNSGPLYMPETFKVDTVLNSDKSEMFAVHIDPAFRGSFTIAQGTNRFHVDTRTAQEQYDLRQQQKEEEQEATPTETSPREEARLQEKPMPEGNPSDEMQETVVESKPAAEAVPEKKSDEAVQTEQKADAVVRQVEDLAELRQEAADLEEELTTLHIDAAKMKLQAEPLTDVIQNLADKVQVTEPIKEKITKAVDTIDSPEIKAVLATILEKGVTTADLKQMNDYVQMLNDSIQGLQEKITNMNTVLDATNKVMDEMEKRN